MKTSTPYDPENPFRAAVTNSASTENIPSPSRTSSGRNTMQDVSLDEGDKHEDDKLPDEQEVDETIKKEFEDLAATGKWGSVSRKEVICVVATVILLLVGVTVAIVLLVGGGSDSSNMLAHSQAPTEAPTGLTVAFASAMDEYTHLKKALALNVLTKEIHLPKNSSELRALSQYEDDPFVSAAAWIFFKDPDNLIEGSLERFALVSLYYAWNGDEWSDYQKWLNPQLHVCDWTGVTCGVDDAGSKLVTELDLSNNNLAGTVPPTLAMLEGLTALRLGDNHLTGRIEGEVFRSLEKLTLLELQHNEFIGRLPKTMRGPSLESLHVEFTGVYGTWPFCDNPMKNFTMDCGFVPCYCCDSSNCVTV
ncbi:hypothetical protein MPSEU_000133700 [Mayamaea pseudoterrestris]|nr:hypothetical protein MPSEU_000133700 [Mayamaea pseudoterrestris]